MKKHYNYNIHIRNIRLCAINNSFKVSKRAKPDVETNILYSL